jgi:hypothetical protein
MHLNNINEKYNDITGETTMNELQRLYLRIHELTQENERLRQSSRKQFNQFLVIDPTNHRPVILSDFTQACYLAVDLTKMIEPVAVYGIEHLGQTRVSTIVDFEPNKESANA